jgi:large subunit ribosomal protein L3
VFANGDRVDIIGTGRGKGFRASSGGITSRGAATHGSMFHRAPGSIGASSFPVACHQGHARRGADGRRPRHDSQPQGAQRRPGQPSADRRRRHPGAPSSYVVVRKAVAKKKLKVAQVEKPKKAKK